MEFPTSVYWTSLFPFEGLFGGIFHFYSFLKKFLSANSGEPDQTPCFAASDLVLHCLLMFHKKKAWLIWINYCDLGNCVIPNEIKFSWISTIYISRSIL